MSSSVKVAVRLRPMNEREIAEGKLQVVQASPPDKTITTNRRNGNIVQRNSFKYNSVFSSFATQKQVFESTLKPMMRDVLDGFEITALAYGQTGKFML